MNNGYYVINLHVKPICGPVSIHMWACVNDNFGAHFICVYWYNSLSYMVHALERVWECLWAFERVLHSHLNSRCPNKQIYLIILAVSCSILVRSVHMHYSLRWRERENAINWIVSKIMICTLSFIFICVSIFLIHTLLTAIIMLFRFQATKNTIFPLKVYLHFSTRLQLRFGNRTAYTQWVSWWRTDHLSWFPTESHCYFR